MLRQLSVNTGTRPQRKHASYNRMAVLSNEDGRLQQPLVVHARAVLLRQPILRAGAHAQEEARKDEGNEEEHDGSDGVRDGQRDVDGVHLLRGEHEGPHCEHQGGAECDAGGAKDVGQTSEVTGRSVVDEELFLEDVGVCGK